MTLIGLPQRRGTRTLTGRTRKVRGGGKWGRRHWSRTMVEVACDCGSLIWLRTSYWRTGACGDRCEACRIARLVSEIAPQARRRAA